MSRYNVFFMIHKGLRAMMYDVSLSLQHTDFAHAEGYPHSLEKLEHVVEIFDAHAGHEDGHIFPLLQACNRALQEEMEQEHVTDIALSNSLRELTTQYKSATDADIKRTLGNRICYTYYDYVAFNLKHMNKEETIVNESLWNYYADADIVKANMDMIASLSPEEVRRNVIWMMRGCSNGDLTGWMSVLKKQVPEPVFNNVLGIARAELPEQRFEAVQNALMAMA